MSNVQCPTSRLVIGHSTLDICLSYGEGGIRTPDRGISPYNGLANRRLQPLGHLSNKRLDCKLRGQGRPREVVRPATNRRAPPAVFFTWRARHRTLGLSHESVPAVLGDWRHRTT